MAVDTDRRTFRRCTSCGAYDGQRVWRLRVDPQLYWPGPVEGGKDHPASKAREAGAAKFVAESGLYETDLETVSVGDDGVCVRCAQRKTPTASRQRPASKR